jgi:OmcA/MtrC family decaheme c-type cytochrome
MERCNDCHALTTTHGSNRNNAIEDCQVCHNANAARGGGGPMDMKHFLHRKHAVDEIRYPQRTSNCLACHTDDGFYPVTSDSGVLASSVNRVDPDNPAPGPAPQADATNNNRISPNATACGVCHQSADAEVHMVQNGSSFDACQETDGTLLERINYCGTGGDKTGALVVESCSVCHGAGRSADVAHAHRLAL